MTPRPWAADASRMLVETYLHHCQQRDAGPFQAAPGNRLLCLHKESSHRSRVSTRRFPGCVVQRK